MSTSIPFKNNGTNSCSCPEPVAYGKLLAETQPMVIESDEEYKRALSIVESLFENEEPSLEEEFLSNLWITLIEKYEKEVIPSREVSLRDILLHLMDARNLKQADLVGVIGSSGVVSEVVNGKRDISKKQAKALASFFGVSPSLFLQ